LNSISDKYLPLTTFLGVGHPGLENINKFPLESTSPDSFLKSISRNQISLVEDPTYKFNTYSLLIVLYFENKN
jgi:hypothetical protein